MGSSESKREKHHSPPTPPPNPELVNPWREIVWGKEEKARLMKEIRTLTPKYKEAKELRIMMAGQIKAGKSSYINTIDSVFQGHLTSRALVGEDKYSFTTKFKPYRVEDCANGEGDGVLPFVLYDVMGIDNIVKSPDVFVSLVKGHIKDGYTFNPFKSSSDDSSYVNKNPTVNDVAHCLVYFVAADQLSIMDDHVLRLITEIRSVVSNIDIPQAVLLTKVDKACPLVGKDVRKVYRSKYIKSQIERFHQISGIPVNCILPVKNYSEEISLNDDIDVLALTALLQILRFANGHLLNLKQMEYKK
ncbi:interferon-induced protein 44-like isoform X1 [Lepisosteus oculatus]|uniref:interferon-induced protein 44-like isoform X1 n=1 Tax=Lepisosteus oculatus TaxID=7918 RepID=UPI0035F5121E